LQIYTNSQYRIDICGNSKFPKTIFSFSIINKLRLDASKRKDTQQRYIFEVTKENISYCKDLMQSSQLRHLEENEANFAVNETECLGFVTVQKELLQATYSNSRQIVEQEQSIFETLWTKAIPAEDKIREIEEGTESQFLQIISDRKKATEIYIDLARSVNNEALLLFANGRAMQRADKLGILDCLIDASQKKGALVKIISPLTEENSQIVQRICDRAPSVKILNGGSSHSGLFIVDSAKFIRFELREPKAEEFSEAIGFVEYSNSKVGVYSARSFFELLWNEHVQYEKLKQADDIKDQFINIAAHELRTPIQPILSLSQVLQSKINDPTQRELLDTIVRNARRLQRLTEDVLDVTKIESHSLNLNRERFNLSDVISSTIDDIKNQIEKCSDGKLKLFYENDIQGIFVEADKQRLIQVLSNLLNNAIKFTEEGNIYIDTEVDDKSSGVGKSHSVTVTVKDTGEGIDPEIMPRLFEKFASKSFEGTGLGLFICKSIIEAHHGRIWAKNNSDIEKRTRGATFCFSLPVPDGLSGRQKQLDTERAN
jgi:two-component system, OmpR family, sensor histidine kinase VicK